MNDRRAEFMRLWLRCATLPEVANLFGLSAEEMGLALHYARISKVISNASGKSLIVAPPALPTDKTWCTQCETRVVRAKAESCVSPWCKAKEAMAA